MALPAPWRGSISNATSSVLLTGQTAFWVLLGCAAAANAVDTPGDTLHYFSNHWYGIMIGIILPTAYRARQGYEHAQTVQSLQDSPPLLAPAKGTT
jgi:hypothetical protein